ncbi:MULTISPECIES: hypothetical protein [Virgibacillus]|uniref:hypothetical protein n=1 Tax=Virgibacillus TaxID=84406 RepID=UPI000AEB1B4D|nr:MULTISPECIES: hypothetical protein [Virgibacillus]
MLTEKGFHVEEADIKRLFERIKARVKAEDMVLIAGSLPTNFTIDNLRQLLRILKEIGCFIPHVRCCKTPTLRVGVYGTNLNGR